MMPRSNLKANSTNNGFSLLSACGKAAAATVVAVLVLSGLLISEHIQQEIEGAREPVSFVQISEKSHRHAKTSLQHGSEKQCPEELLARHQDCQVVSARNSAKIGNDQGSLRPSSGEHTLMSFYALDPLPGQSYAVLGWKPVIQKVQTNCPSSSDSVSLIHHINAYLDLRPPPIPLETGRIYRDKDPEIMAREESNSRLAASHDKMATEYLLPEGYGIPCDSPITMETHILMPTCWDYSSPVEERSGLDLYITTEKPRHEAALIGALNFNMHVEPNQGSIDYVTRMPAEALATIFASSTHKDSSQSFLAPSAGPEILAVHLHTHDLTQHKSFEVLNEDGTVAFSSPEEEGGYGAKQQSFANLKDKGWPALKLHPGQQLRQHCKIQTNGLKKPVVYGLDWGDEMCGPLLLVGGPDLRMTTTLLSTTGFMLRVGASLRRRLEHSLRDVLRDIRKLI
eukprot:TRINITY_DN33432_c0_g1_i1.p1 TRINITY_DN33432_c0_g1~~TRINITY_DN33432_c0_g1_i1.p1  ORF type:complete len:454 (+),score=79.09 TRINITY_DN33432_c0_g1_i1:87-1448(+)